MRVRYAPSFHRSTLSKAEKQRCYRAIERFKARPFQRGLNYERLGKGPRQNHCSIRASEELRIILAVAPDFQDPQQVVLVNMGHHDPMYRWADAQGYYTDIDVGVDPEDMAGAPVSVQVLSAMENFDEWQLFVHPDQRPLVQRQYAGEARIRGAAGTGKTVVALHRTVELGRRFSGEKVLFTTFSRSLTEHLKRLFLGLPDAPNNVEFSNIDRIAYRIADPSIDARRVDQAFEAAYEAVIPKTTLERCSPSYLRDEVAKVIKGRAATKEEYLDTDRFERIGRRRRFSRVDREACWRLREVWDAKMRDAGTIDFADALIDARDQARARDFGEYRAAIIDEAQDMTLVGVQLVRALVSGDPRNPVPADGLLLVDDAAQRIYTGGFRLSWAQIRVGGRSEILQKNYRNTKPIVEAAKAIRGDTLPVREDDDDGAALHASYEREDGPLPTFLRVGRRGEVPALVAEIQALVKEERLEMESIAVLTRGNDDADRIARWLRSKCQIPCAMLRDLRGTRPLGAGVRVGTFDRSKGLDFRAVLIPRLGASVFPKDEEADEAQLSMPVLRDAPTELTEEEREARQLDLDRLYVGMTRAKERVFLISDESPCPEIERASDLLEWRRLG